ncbi:MAG: LUD domain-containing protein [Candidatus Aminicenantes bacterium]
MWKKRKVKKALQDKNLQKALGRASSHHFKKFDKTKNEIPWQEYKAKAKSIREECVKKLPQLIKKFTQEAHKAGARVYFASTPAQALSQIEKIARQKKAKLLVKSKSMVSEEIGLNRYLEKKGYRVVETDLGEWIIQLAEERPSHITAPALHKTKQEVAEILSRHLHQKIPPRTEEMVKHVRQQMRKIFTDADIGISGANLAIAESGTLAIISNEGNARLVTSLPPVHIALVSTEKFVETLEQAASLIKALTVASAGTKLTSYVSFITGPSRTTDIEKELVIGVHGPQEVHIIILDNQRLHLSQDKDLDKILYCLKCGGCMLVCPVFQSIGGHVFGGPVYPGGIGTLLTAVTESARKASGLLDFCAHCKKCQEFCPVGVPTSELILKLKSQKGPSLWEKVVSAGFSHKAFSQAGTKILSWLQSLWKEDHYLKNLPFKQTRNKFIPAFHIKKPPPAKGKNGEKIYLFEGCLVKFFFPEIRESILTSLSSLGFQVVSPADQSCCGAPGYHLGDKKAVKKLALKNIKSLERENPDFILTVCPTGNAMLKKNYPQLEPKARVWIDKIFDFTEFISKKHYVPEKKIHPSPEEIYYHYPCHYVNCLELRGEPEKVLRRLGFKPKVEEDPLACCGFCGVFSLKNPDISARLWEKKKQIIEKNKHPLVATDCPGCLFQLRAGLKEGENAFKAFHTAELFARVMEQNAAAAGKNRRQP